MSASTELFEAIERHETSRVQTLLAGGADPNALQQDRPHLRALHAEFNELEDGGSLAVVELLCELARVSTSSTDA